uniref:Uncharacterized protein n=1 Tax=Arundo donax TaxID=35708 RepID=A0A0A9FCN0_ARUDO
MKCGFSGFCAMALQCCYSAEAGAETSRAKRGKKSLSDKKIVQRSESGTQMSPLQGI